MLSEEKFLLGLQCRIRKRLLAKQEEKKTLKKYTLQEVKEFLFCMKQYNFRDYLIAKMILFSSARISDVLSIALQDVELDISIVHVGSIRGHLSILLNKTFCQELTEYIGKRISGYLFISRMGKVMNRSRLNHAFCDVAVKFGCKAIQPDALRLFSIDNYAKHGEGYEIY